MKTQSRISGSLILGIAAMVWAGNSHAYTTSKDAHAACDPTGVQYDYTNKQYCCGTKGGCPIVIKPATKDTARPKANVKAHAPDRQGTAK